MIDNLSTAALDAVAPAPTPASNPGAPAPAADAGSTAARPSTGTAQTAAQPATRMLIEANGAQGYVYRLVEAVTGRLLVEVPRERLEDLASHSAYSAGALVSTSA